MNDHPAHFTTGLRGLPLIAAAAMLTLLAGCSMNTPRSAKSLPPTDHTVLPKLSTAAVEESEKLSAQQDELLARIERARPAPQQMQPVAPVYDPLENRVVTINMYDADVGRLLWSLADQLGMNLIVDPKVLAQDQRASLYLRNVTAREVYNHILQAFDLHGEMRGGALVVGQMEERIFNIEMLNANSSLDLSTGGDVFGAGLQGGSAGGGGQSLRGMLVMEGSVGKANDPYKQLDAAIAAILEEDKNQAQTDDKKPKPDMARYNLDPMTGSLYVRARPSQVRAIAELVQQNKQMLGRQVLIEAQLIDVSLNDGFEFGVDWTLLRNRLAGVYGNDPLQLSPVGPIGEDGVIPPAFPAGTEHTLEPRSITIPAQLIGSAAGRGTGLAYAGSTFSAALNMLREFGNVKVLSNPSVRVRNGTPAYLSVGANIRYVAESSTTFSNPGGGATNTSSDVQTDSLFSGVVVGVAPMIHEDGTVELLVHPMQTEVVPGSLALVPVGAGSSVTLPVINVKGLTTTLNLNDGDTVLLGGLIDQQMSGNDRGIPGVSDVPGLGNLFGSKSNGHSSRELVVVLRVRVL